MSPSCVPTVHRFSSYWGGPPQSLGSGPGWKLGKSDCQFSLFITTWRSSPALPQMAHSMQPTARSRVSSPAGYLPLDRRGKKDSGSSQDPSVPFEVTSPLT